MNLDLDVGKLISSYRTGMLQQFIVIFYLLISSVSCFRFGDIGRSSSSKKVTGSSTCRRPVLTLHSAVDENNLSTDCCNKGNLGSHQVSSSLCSSGEIRIEDLSDENIVKIVRMECTDEDANVFIWKCLGYVYDEQTQTWNADNVFPKW